MSVSLTRCNWSLRSAKHRDSKQISRLHQKEAEFSQPTCLATLSQCAPKIAQRRVDGRADGSLKRQAVNSLVVGFVLCAAYYFTQVRRSEAALPPGPKGYPFVGNAFSFPATYQWLFFSRLRRQYGDIVSLKVFSSRIIILNKRQDMLALTVKKHDNYALRPSFTTWEASGWTQITGLHNGPLWKEHRRFMGNLFGTRQLMQKFYRLEIHEMRKFLRNVCNTPDDLDHHIHYLAGSLILKIVYGYDAQDYHDDFIEKVDSGMADFADILQTGRYPVDLFPWLSIVPEWLPGGGWKTRMREYSQRLEQIVSEPFELVKQRMNAGTAVPCYVTDLLQAEGESLTPEKEYVIKTSAGSVYVEVQRKAQAEIDSVVGRDKLPDFSDRDDLPYVEAILKELMRFHTVIPLSGPRSTLKDDFLNGYLIPKDTTIIPNSWEMSHDPEVYADPFLFNPDRFLGENPELNPKELFFGFGRRICPGQHLADVSTWLACAMSLAVFDIQRTKDSPPDITFMEGETFTGEGISRPFPFKCSITPRSAKAEALIRSIDHE
ncbi:hypothetical protein EIP91_003837 [Steccherinum ochraceum]|uniref:Cytochrome P450 n=1 Tax=Steccherinum ochraceum TaxID=92696 RepID=A0A4R0RG55_9APHY|nr:hypothetical protein EIP91_003837 [Steccherinum ochraceum]